MGFALARLRAAAASRFRLHDDWSRVLRHAWSQRFIAAAALLSGAEAVLPLFTSDPPIPVKWFALLVLCITAAAFVARLLAQKNMGPSE